MAMQDTFAYSDGAITVTAAFGTITSVGVSDTGNMNDRDVLVNGNPVGTLPADNSGNFRTITFTFAEVNATSITVNVGGLNAVNELYVNGALLVDDGIAGAPNLEAFVTGPTLPAASGTVASVDAVATPPTMTLSASDGRWLVTEDDYQEDLKLNKVAQSPNYR